MKRQKTDLPIITIDPDLVKSTNESNKKYTSPIGEMFGFRTPAETELELMQDLPPFTDFLEGMYPVNSPRRPGEKEDKHQERLEKARKGLQGLLEEAEALDYETPLSELIKPRRDLLRTPEQIEGWIRANYHWLNRPSHYVGHEINCMDPSLYEGADLRVLIVRLSAYDNVQGSLTHGALAEMSWHAAEKYGFKVYTDMTFMPGLMKDCDNFREHKVPWLFGRTSKRHPADFDVIFISCAVTLEVWNIIPALIYSGVSPFKTQRGIQTRLDDPAREPVVVMGGVVSDFIEMINGEVAGERGVADVMVIGDGEYTVEKTLKCLWEHKKAGKTKGEFLRAGHDLPEAPDFERDPGDKRKFSWWYEADLYNHIYGIEEGTGYKVLKEIRRAEGADHAAPPGQIKRAVVRDLEETPVWVATPVSYDGSIGGAAVDIQISCVTGDTVIETDMGFETISEAYERLQDPDEVGGVMVQTRSALQAANAIVKTGVKTVRTHVFQSDEGGHEYRITCTAEHKFDVRQWGESTPDWCDASDLEVGQEVWACDPEKYKAAREGGGRINILDQHYYADNVTVALREIGEPFEAETFDVQEVEEVNEYVANGIHVHNSGCLSGGLCSFCLAEGTLVTVKDPETKKMQQVPIERLEDNTYAGDLELREFDTPFGPQRAEAVLCTGVKKCVTLVTERGHEITLTPEHEMLTSVKGVTQKRRAGELGVGDLLLLTPSVTGVTFPDDRPPEQDFLFQGVGAPRPPKDGVYGVLSFDPEGMAPDFKDQKGWYRALRRINAYADKIKEIRDAGEHRVYDVWNIPKGHVFYAGGFLTGNCHLPGTEVQLASGNTLPIEEVEPGHAIVTAHGKVRPVANRFVREVDEEVGVWRVEGMEESLRSTLNHEFPCLTGDAVLRLAELGGEPATWQDLEKKPLGEIWGGDYLAVGLLPDGNPDLRKVVEMGREPYQGPVYNLEVSVGSDDPWEHTYRVGLDPRVRLSEAEWAEVEALERDLGGV